MGSFMIPNVNSDYFLKQRQPIDLCNGEVLCFLYDTELIIKYFHELLRLKMIKMYLHFHLK
jgi:hypothetical protein